MDFDHFDHVEVAVFHTESATDALVLVKPNGLRIRVAVHSPNWAYPRAGVVVAMNADDWPTLEAIRSGLDPETSIPWIEPTRSDMCADLATGAEIKPSDDPGSRSQSASSG